MRFITLFTPAAFFVAMLARLYVGSVYLNTGTVFLIQQEKTKISTLRQAIRNINQSLIQRSSASKISIYFNFQNIPFSCNSFAKYHILEHKHLKISYFSFDRNKINRFLIVNVCQMSTSVVLSVEPFDNRHKIQDFDRIGNVTWWNEKKHIAHIDINNLRYENGRQKSVIFFAIFTGE